MSKKRKRILKVVLPLVVILFVVYHLVFYVVKVPKYYLEKLEADYGEYILMSHSIQLRYFFPSLPEFRFLSNLAGDSGKYGGSVERTLFFFQWDADALKKELLASFKKRVEEIGKLPAVVNYTYDEKTFDVDITLDKFNKEYYDALDAYDELREEYSFIRRFCKYNSTFNYKSGSIECHEVSSDTREQERKTEIKKYAYDEQEVDLLNKIITSSLEQKSFDLEDEDKIQGDSEDRTGGHICYLDLSDYNYITGKLDLSGFSKLKYVSIRGMKISEVVLPESLEYIDEKSFAYCERLEKIVIPENVKSFENPVFYGCKNLKEIIFEGDAPEISWEKEDIFGKVPEDLIIYRKKSAKGWQETVWDKYDVRIIY